MSTSFSPTNHSPKSIDSSFSFTNITSSPRNANSPIAPISPRRGSPRSLYSQNMSIQNSNVALPSHLAAQIHTLFQTYTPPQIHKISQNLQGTISSHRTQVNEALDENMESVLGVAKVLGGEMRAEGDAIKGIVQEWHRWQERIGAEGEPVEEPLAPLQMPSLHDVRFLLRNLQSEGMYLHAAMILRYLPAQTEDRLIFAEEILAEMLSEERQAKESESSGALQNFQYFLDVDLCQKLLAFHMLSGELDEDPSGTATYHHLLQSFLDFQFGRLATLHDALQHPHHNTPRLTPQIIANYIYTFLLSHLCFSSDILERQCVDVSQFLQTVVAHANKDVNFVHTYQHLYQQLFAVLLREQSVEGFAMILQKASETRSEDSAATTHLSPQQIEETLTQYHKETLPILERLLRALLDQCRESSAPQGSNAELLLQTYDQLVTLLDTCHIQFNQKTLFFDSQDIASVWNRSFHQDTLIPSVRSLLERLFHEEQTQIIDDAFGHAQQRINAYLSDIALPLNRIKLNIEHKSMESATQAYFAQNASESTKHELNLSSYLWQNLQMGETLLQNRFSSYSASSMLNRAGQQDGLGASSIMQDWKIHYQSFDPLVNSITNHIFSEILIRDIHNVFPLIQRERERGIDANTTSVENTLYQSILQSIRSTIYPYIQQQVGEVGSNGSSEDRIAQYRFQPDMTRHHSTDTIIRHLFFGRLAQAVEESFNQLMSTVASIAAPKQNTHTKANEDMVQTLNDIYVDCHQLWIEYVCDEVRDLLAGVNYYETEVSTDNWPPHLLPDTDPPQSIRIPFAPSPFILRTLECINHHIFNIGSYKLKNQLLPILCEALTRVYVAFFSSFLETRQGESVFPEHSALQLLFDLRLLACVFFILPFDRLQSKTHANTSDLPQHQKDFVQLVDRLHGSSIDAINWETYEKYFVGNLQAHLHSHYLHYGLFVFHHVTPQNKRGKTASGAAPSPSIHSTSTEFIATSQSVGAPFSLLPVQKTQFRSDTTDQVTTQDDQTTSKFASFLKGFGW